MAKASGDVSRTVCANTVQQNERRLREARIRNQGKGRVRQDLNKLFGKINQAVEASSLKSSKRLGLSCYSRSVSNCWYGPIPEFPPGSWWGIRMDCSRDRIHEPFDADIHEGPFGVISICTSHANVNEDVDFGDYLTLTGQVYHPEQSSVDPLICNYKNQIPLRLIRSYNLQDDIAPNTGYRYDGLYTVISSWIGIASDGTKYNKFALMRLADQGSPSWSNKDLEELSSMRHYIPLTKSNHSNTYDLRKCSNNVGITYGKRKLSHGDNLESRSIAKVTPLNDTSKQSAPESSIVTRHVFKKLPSNADNAISTTVPDQKMLLCLGASTTKTHSTNISIRMGLYESSHNSQDAKKNVSTMLHKPSKPIDITIRTALDIESSRLTPKEESKPNKRTDVDKVRFDPRPSENVSCNGHIVADYASKVASPLDKRKENLLETIQSEHSHSISLLQTSLENDVTIERKEQLLNAQQNNVQDSSINNELLVQKLNPSNKSLRDSVTHKKTCEHHDILETPSESLRAQDIKSLDSLTPDKILNLINKEMHHPLSKLLIGNVIGLTIEECAIWNASKTETTPNSKKNVSARTSLRRKRKGTDNIKENVACLDNRRYCKYAKSERLFWKVSKQADGGKFDKVLPSVDQSCNDENQKRNSNVRRSDRNNMSKENNEYLSSFRVQTSLQTIAQHTRNSYDIKTRLRADKTAVLAKPEFPKSSIKKSKYKKRDREIANLSIDANFGPATRGPRNRRLRCKNNAYTRCCGTFNTVMYSPNKRCKSTFERKSKLTKISRQRVGEKQTKDRYRMSNTVHTNSKDINLIAKQKNLKGNSGNNNNNNNNNNENRNNYNDNSVNNRKKENETATAGDRDVIKASFDKNLRKKLTIPLSQTPRLHCFRKKQIEKPSTMDATTQCRLISENPEVYVIGQLNDQKAILKMEWDKLEKLQSVDVPDGRWSQVYQASQYCAISALAEDNASRKSDEEYVDSPQDRTSAFVPVNAFDNDLRIARLRSIGFKPIITPRSPSLVARDLEIIQNALVQTTSKVTKRDVAEEYYKYANNEDNNAVVYMDDELQYQDIEEEDDDEKQLAANPTIKSTLRGQSKRDNVLAETLPSRELESPWHGWKKIVKNNESYWIGW
ncbi:hypothetical protein P5V15_003263 [Pogonomyrmex californicus]